MTLECLPFLGVELRPYASTAELLTNITEMQTSHFVVTIFIMIGQSFKLVLLRTVALTISMWWPLREFDADRLHHQYSLREVTPNTFDLREDGLNRSFSAA